MTPEEEPGGNIYRFCGGDDECDICALPTEEHVAIESEAALIQLCPSCGKFVGALATEIAESKG